MRRCVLLSVFFFFLRRKKKEKVIKKEKHADRLSALNSTKADEPAITE